MTPIIRLNKDAQSLLTTLAENLGVSEQDALQIAVDRFISAHDTHTIAARTIDSLLVRDAALIERLGNE